MKTMLSGLSNQLAELGKENRALRADVERLKQTHVAARSWRKCETHGDIDGAHQWGCPECVRELRAKVEQLEQESKGGD